MNTERHWTTVAGQLLVVLALAGVLIPSISPGAAVKGDVVIKLLFLGRMLVLLAAATWFLRLRGLRWSDVGLAKPRWLRFFLAIPLGLAATLAAVGGLGFAMGQLGVHGGDYSMFNPVRGNLPQYLFWVLPVTWGSAALGEELMFRGFVRDALERILGGGQVVTIAAIVLQAALFGVLHLYQGAGGAMTAGTIGLVLGFVWLFSGRNLWAPIVIHGLIDSASMTAIYLNAVPHS